MEELEAAARASVLPDKSKDAYYKHYRKFVEWLEVMGTLPSAVTVQTLAAYVEHLSGDYCANSMWTMLSCIRKGRKIACSKQVFDIV